MPFDGETYDRLQDGERLKGQLRAVFDVFVEHYGEWMILDVLVARVRVKLGGAMVSYTGISARARDLRKKKFGEHPIRGERTQPDSGLWHHRLSTPAQRIEERLRDEAEAAEKQKLKAEAAVRKAQRKLKKEPGKWKVLGEFND